MQIGEEPDAAADPACRLTGVDGLSITDWSILPRIIIGDFNGPSIMTGGKASDHILGRDPLPRDNRQPLINPSWQESDRWSPLAAPRHQSRSRWSGVADQGLPGASQCPV